MATQPVPRGCSSVKFIVCTLPWNLFPVSHQAQTIQISADPVHRASLWKNYIQQLRSPDPTTWRPSLSLTPLVPKHSTLLGPHQSFRYVSVPDIAGIHSTYINEAILRRLASGGKQRAVCCPHPDPCQLLPAVLAKGRPVLQALAPLPLPVPDLPWPLDRKQSTRD